MAQGTPMPFVATQWFTNAGAPAASHKLFTYAAGTTTKLATYSDVDLSAANANPIVLDSAGRATVFLTAASYKFVLAPSTDSDPPVAAIWTRDNVSSIPGFNVNLDVTAVAGEALSANDAVYLSDGTGGLTAGRWYKTDSDNTYSSTLATVIGFAPSAIASAASGSVRVGGRLTGLAGLTIGSVYYLGATAGAITATAPTNKRAIGTADTATTLIIGLAEGANETTGPLPAISGASLLGVDKYVGSVVATVGNVGAGEDILATTTLAAARLVTNGESIKGIFWGKTANNANTKTLIIRVIEGGNNNAILNVALTISEAGHWMAGFAAIRTGATTCRAAAQALCGPTNAAASFSGGSVTSSFTATWANAVEFRVTGTATADNDVTVEGGYWILVSV